ncbi:MAG: fibronectin type III domain-containing protein [Thermoanaerobaculia bacterium]
MKTIARSLLVVLALGCGKAGPPTPPIPQIPRAATDLVVAQQGPTVVLSWSFPSLTVAGTTLRSVEQMQVYRVVEELPPSGLPTIEGREGPQPGAPVRLELFRLQPPFSDQQFRILRQRIGELTGPQIPAALSGARVVYRDNPPIQTTDGRPVRLHYVVVFESETEVSGPSNIASLVPLGVGLPSPSAIATPRAEGVELTWEAPNRDIFGEQSPAVAGYNVYRVPPASDPFVLQTPLNAEPITDRQYLDVPPYGDFEYRIAAVASMEPQRSEGDPAIVAAVTFADLTPPPVPENVITLTEEESIRLVWDPVEADDLAGYRVYRQTTRGRVSLAWEPLTDPTYVDTILEPGETYIYSVSSVDEKGNESERAEAAPVLSPK